MDLGISGKTAFVVGGSKGMGREVSLQLADEGVQVAVVARDKQAIDETVAAIVARGGTAIGVSADIGDAAAVNAAVEQVTRELSAPLIVVGQTKFNIPGDFADITDTEQYVESFRSYTMSQIYLLQAVLPAMKQAGWGRYVHIGSATAKEPEGAIHHAIANATRPSTIGLLKTVSDEYAQYGITVNTVAPGWIETENAKAYMNAQVGLQDEAARREWVGTVARVPARRLGAPSEIASYVVYLCSDQAGYVNGTWVEVDGGHHRSAM